MDKPEEKPGEPKPADKPEDKPADKPEEKPEKGEAPPWANQILEAIKNLSQPETAPGAAKEIPVPPVPKTEDKPEEQIPGTPSEEKPEDKPKKKSFLDWLL